MLDAEIISQSRLRWSRPWFDRIQSSRAAVPSRHERERTLITDLDAAAASGCSAIIETMERADDE
jgi:hypothetical protein